MATLADTLHDEIEGQGLAHKRSTESLQADLNALEQELYRYA